MHEAYCPSCKEYFTVQLNPPYSVIHISDDEHVHAISRIKLSPVTDVETKNSLESVINLQ